MNNNYENVDTNTCINQYFSRKKNQRVYATGRGYRQDSIRYSFTRETDDNTEVLKII